MIDSIHYDAGHGNIENIRVCLARSPELVNLKDDVLGDTPLIHALTRGQEQAVNFLLQNGADPSIPDKEGDNALHVLIVEWFSDDKSISDEICCNMVKQLITAKPQILDQNNNSNHPRTPIALVELMAKGEQEKSVIKKRFLDIVQECVPNRPSVAPEQQDEEPDVTVKEEKQTQNTVDSESVKKESDSQLRHRHVSTAINSTSSVIGQFKEHSKTSTVSTVKSSWLSWFSFGNKQVPEEKRSLLDNTSKHHVHSPITVP